MDPVISEISDSNMTGPSINPYVFVNIMLFNKKQKNDIQSIKHNDIIYCI